MRRVRVQMRLDTPTAAGGRHAGIERSESAAVAKTHRQIQGASSVARGSFVGVNVRRAVPPVFPGDSF